MLANIPGHVPTRLPDLDLIQYRDVISGRFSCIIILQLIPWPNRVNTDCGSGTLRKTKRLVPWNLPCIQVCPSLANDLWFLIRTLEGLTSKRVSSLVMRLKTMRYKPRITHYAPSPCRTYTSLWGTFKNQPTIVSRAPMGHKFYPTETLGDPPLARVSPHAQGSPIRAAGTPFIITVEDPPDTTTS